MPRRKRFFISDEILRRLDSQDVAISLNKATKKDVIRIRKNPEKCGNYIGIELPCS